MKIKLSAPEIRKEEIELVNQVMKSGVLSIGPMVEDFEEAFRRYFNVKYAIAVNSGTSGLHLVVRALGIGEGDEVITSPFSFIASTNCILFERAKPIFVDIDEKTLNIDIRRIEEKITSKTKAILPVDVFGQPVDMEVIMSLAQKHNLKVIQDSCESIGSEYRGIKSGTIGDAGVFAFYPNKQITTGEGGMIITKSEEVARLCASMRSQGRGATGQWLHHERMGYNYRMSEVNAAIGVVQIKRLEEIIQRRQAVADAYTKRLTGIPGVKVPDICENVTKMSWFVYVIRLEQGIDRDCIMGYLRLKGIECKPYFSPIHLQPYMKALYGHKEGDFPITESVGSRTIALPFYNGLSNNQIDYVAENLEKAIAATS